MANIMTVRVPDELQARLKRLAKKEGYTRNGLVLYILWKWVRDNEKSDTIRHCQH